MKKIFFGFILSMSYLFGCGCSDPQNANIGETNAKSNYTNKDNEFASSIEKINENFQNILDMEQINLNTIKEIDKTSRVDLVNLQEVLFEVTKRNNLIYHKAN